MYPMYGGFPPQQPIVFVPSPGTPSGGLSVDNLTDTISKLEAIKKALKEEKKEEKKEKKSDVGVLNVMMFMILMSPITGPIMSRFFSYGLSMLPH